jgi:hypothetical protein
MYVTAALALLTERDLDLAEHRLVSRGPHATVVD